MKTDHNFNSFTNTYQFKSELEQVLIAKLKGLQCHFNWNYNAPDNYSESSKTFQEKISILKGKKEYKINETKIQLNQICYYCREIQLAFYETVMGNFEAAKASYSNASAIVRSISEPHIHKGMLYILECNKLFLLYLLGQYNECSEKVTLMQGQFERFETLEKSIVMGIYAISLIDSGTKGCIKSVDLLRKVCIMDPNTFEWPLRLGMALMKIREDVDPLQFPSKEELYNFKLAVNLASVTDGGSARPVMYYTKSNLELGNKLSNSKYILHEAIKTMKIALKRGPDTEIVINFLDAILNHPDLSRFHSIPKIIDETLKEHSNSYMINFVAGMFYKIHKKDYTRALYYLEKADKMKVKYYQFQLEMNLLDLRFHGNEDNNDVISSLTKLSEKYYLYPEKCRIILCLRGVFYMFRTDTMILAVNDWIEALGKDREKYQITFLSTLLNRATLMGNLTHTSFLFDRLISAMERNTSKNEIQILYCKELTELFNTFNALNYNEAITAPGQNSNYPDYNGALAIQQRPMLERNYYSHIQQNQFYNYQRLPPPFRVDLVIIPQNGRPLAPIKYSVNQGEGLANYQQRFVSDHHVISVPANQGYFMHGQFDIHLHFPSVNSERHQQYNIERW